MTSKGALVLLNDLISELELSTRSESVPDQPAAAPKEVIESKGEVVPKVETDAGGTEQQPAKTKKEKGKKPKVEAVILNPPPKDVETVNALDFRVGVITSVKKHETADKLYCEEIDVGEAEPRQIASGLVPHYTLEQMMGKRLIVVANLKPRNLVGFKSFGMVLCAAKTDADGKEFCEFVDPPADAVPGDRIIGEGIDYYDPLTNSQCDKQKIFEKIGAKLSVNSEGVACWDGNRLVVANLGEKGICTAPTVRDAPIR